VLQAASHIGLNRLKKRSDLVVVDMQSLMPGNQHVWPDLVTSPDDVILLKNRSSASISGSSALEPMLRNHGINTILMAGTKYQLSINRKTFAWICSNALR
jgi:isochorismate hydrolase